MRHLLRAVSILSLLAIAATTASAATITLKADGTGDYPTIQDAVDAAGPLDEIVLEPGTYTGSGNVNVQVTTPDLTIRGDQGSAVTIIDCASSDGITVELTNNPGDFAITGLTIDNAFAAAKMNRVSDFSISDLEVPNAQANGLYISNCWTVSIVDFSMEMSPSAIGIRLFSCQNVTVRDSQVIGSDYGMFGQSVGSVLNQGGGTLLIENCDMIDNSLAGILLDGVNTASLTVANVYCHGNGDTQELLSGGIHIQGFMSAEVTGSTLCHNADASNGSGLYSGVPCDVIGNTVAYNNQTSAVYLGQGGTVSRTIISSTQGGAGLDAAGAAISDCNIWGNSGGDGLGGGTDGGGNISADPMFCGVAGSENYYLTSVSPCAPDNSPGGVRIGAWPVGCGTVDTEATSWGALKSKYQ